MCVCNYKIKGNHLFESGSRAFGGKKGKGNIQRTQKIIKRIN